MSFVYVTLDMLVSDVIDVPITIMVNLLCPMENVKNVNVIETLMKLYRAIVILILENV